MGRCLDGFTTKVVAHVVIALAATGVLRAQSSGEPQQSPDTLLVLHRFDESPTAADWQSVAKLPLVTREPVFGGPMTERTDIRVAYDAEHLYVRARLDDSDPSGIRANSLYRDRMSGDDVLGVVIDPFNDNENGLWFWTTPAGVRGDAAITDDGRSTTGAWNGFWDTAVSRTDSGWTAEVRIPFATLGFRAENGIVTMGLTAYRYIARRNERHVFPAIPPDYDLLRPSRAQRVRLHGVRLRRHVYITPYVLTGIEHELGPVGDGPQRRLARDAGADLHYDPTSQLTIDLTVNTDFAQVEADDQRVNLTRFPLFFPERRRFFQERAGVFGFATGGNGLLFHSRRIGLRDGRPVPILGGIRLVGRAAAWDFGALQMQTAAADSAPAENFGVARARRQILNTQSYVGAMATTRLGANGAANAASGVDAVVHLFGDDYVTVRAAHSFDRPASTSPGTPFSNGGIARVIWERRRSAGTRYIATAGSVGSDYAPGIGFVSRTGVTDAAAAFSRPRYLSGDRAFTRIDPLQLSASALVRHGDSRLESASLEYNSDFEWRSGAEMSVDLEAVYEDVPEDFALPRGTVVPAGKYRFITWDAGFDSPPGELLRGDVDWSVGSFYDGWKTAFASAGSWNASRHVEVAAEYELDVVRFPVRSQGFDSHILRLRLGSALDTRASATALVQYGSVLRELAVNLRLRYNFSEGHDLWLVYDELVGLTAPAHTRRTVLTKYTRTYR